jgi:hypothetical protein
MSSILRQMLFLSFSPTYNLFSAVPGTGYLAIIFLMIFSCIQIFEKAWRTEEGRPAAERERRERGGRAAREGSRAAQGRHIQRQAGRQV